MRAVYIIVALLLSRRSSEDALSNRRIRSRKLIRYNHRDRRGSRRRNRRDFRVKVAVAPAGRGDDFRAVIFIYAVRERVSNDSNDRF